MGIDGAGWPEVVADDTLAGEETIVTEVARYSWALRECYDLLLFHRAERAHPATPVGCDLPKVVV